MRLDRFLSRTRIAELRARDLRGALAELLALPGFRLKYLQREQILTQLLERENTITTYLGNGVALPHIRLRMPRPFLLAVGRIPDGIPYEGLSGTEQVKLVFLLLASEQAQNYLQMLAAIARLVRDRDLVDRLLDTADLDAFADGLVNAFAGVVSRPRQQRRDRLNRILLRQAGRIAKGAECSAVVVFEDSLAEGFDPAAVFGDIRPILVCEQEVDEEHARAWSAVINVRAFARRRLAQLRSALLVGMTRRLIGFRDRLLCLGGMPGSGVLDTLLVVDVEREFSNLLVDPANLLPPGVRPEVLERILAVATELAVVGREGRPVGALFVIGDAQRVERLTKPLVMNPFLGYKDEDRNVLNPFMDETLKEFSLLDGAFVIRGDGVVVSAGSLILATDSSQTLPSGLGARHAAAAAVSRASNSIAVCVSTTGQVTVFRRGLMVPLIEKFSAAAN